MWYLKYRSDEHYLEVWTEDTVDTYDPKTGDKISAEDNARAIGEKQNLKAAAIRKERGLNPNPYELVHVEHIKNGS